MVTIALIGLVGGLVTGVSPCVLPMLPIIFFAGSTAGPGAEGDGGTVTKMGFRARLTFFARPLKITAGLVTSFSLIALFGTTVLSALGLPDNLLLWIGVGVLIAVGLGLIFPPLGHLLERPFYQLPKITNSNAGPFLFGMGLGTLYVPCAGPILAAIVVAGSTGTIGAQTIVMTVSFAVGAALPLLFFAAAGSKASERIKAFRERARGFRISSGVILVVLAVALAFGAPAALQKLIPNYTNGLEQDIAESDTFQGALAPLENEENKELSKCKPGAAKLAECGKAPSLKKSGEWFNTDGEQDVKLDDFKGKVVLVDFFAYSCINCLRDAPHIRDWYDAYGDAGFEVVGIHSPEFVFEKNADNLASAIESENINWPVMQDNDLSTWTNYRNRYWPAKYLIDAEGTVRAIKFGEGDYTGTESKIRSLLKEADADVDLPKAVEDGTQDTPATKDKTPETYLGWSSSKNYSGEPTNLAKDETADYSVSVDQKDDTYSLGGKWTLERKYAVAESDAASQLNFKARKVFHVLAGEGTVTVSVDGGKTRTIEVSGTPNLYEIYSSDKAGRHTVDIEYSKGLEVYTFTFG